MACQKVHKQGRIKSDGKYTKPHPPLHLFTKDKDVGRGFVYLLFFCTFWHAIPTAFACIYCVSTDSLIMLLLNHLGLHPQETLYT